ncbi:MAG: alanine racemase [Acidobacteria bacterium]|nr:alanine racemase [Acidobacteriota bacterium]
MGNPAGKWASELRPTWVEIDLDALARNYARVRELVAPRRVWCVVKADAYGHGAVPVSRRLAAEGADAFAVATVDEGIELREAEIGGDILVMAGVEPLPEGGAGGAPEIACEAVGNDLDVAVWSRAAAEMLGDATRRAGGAPCRVHLKVDTGMGRLGVLVAEAPGAAVELTSQIAAIDGIDLVGVFSNLAAADAGPDDPCSEHNLVQVERFVGFCRALDERGVLPARRHLSNSAAILQHDAAWDADWCTGVRPGISLLGVRSFRGSVTFELESVMSWHSAVAAVRDLPEGWPIGYGGHRRAERDCTIAVVPVGYHDGFPRALSDHAEVLVGGRRAQVVGAISMDLTLVDITGIPGVSGGTPVVLLGSRDDPGVEPIGAEEMAQRAGSIAHEVLCRIGSRVPRRFVGRES